MCIQAAELPHIDCLVLSGGGAKGAYGAGAAKAFFAYRSFKHHDHPVCFIGTSAGALNAVVLAAYGPDRLVQLWRSVTNWQILGFVQDPLAHLLLQFVCPWQWFKSVMRSCGYKWPYSLYSSAGLQRVIKKTLAALNFEDFAANKHLILAVTNYSRGTLNAFYASHLIHEFRNIDDQKEHAKRRIQHLLPIENKDILIKALVASASIPFAFPPQLIGDDWFADGGIGNNTPTREAALFQRFVNEHPDVSHLRAGDVFCVLYDPPGTVMETNHQFGRLEVTSRTYDIFHNTHMMPIIGAWHQINRNVVDHQQLVAQFHGFLQGCDIADDRKSAIKQEFDSRFGCLRGALERLNIELLEVRPAAHLGDLLDFDQEKIGRYIQQGYNDMLLVLRNKNLINDVESNLLAQQINDPVPG